MKRLTIFLAAVLLPFSCFAMQNFKIGSMSVHPFISTEMRYDSNIYLTDTDETGAYINQTGLGITAEQKAGNFNIDGGYKMDLLTYSEDQSANNAVHHNLYLKAETVEESKTNVKFSENFLATTDAAASELTERQKRTQNDVSLGVESEFNGKFGYTVNLGHTMHNYLGDAIGDILDRNEFRIGAGATYQVAPKTKGFLSYEYGNINYSERDTSDATYHKIALGLKGKISGKLTGTISTDIEIRNYGDDLSIGGETADDNTTVAGFTAGLEWVPQTDAKLAITGRRANVESVYGLNRYYTSSLLDINYAHRMARKITANVGASWESAVYPEKTWDGAVFTDERSDRYLGFRLGANYEIQKWLTASAGYKFLNRNSNEDGLDYNSSVVSANVKAMF